MGGALSLPVLLLLGWGIAGLLWWESRRNVISREQRPWMIAAMVLIVIAMGLALGLVPGRTDEQVVRSALLLEGLFGLIWLARRGK